MNSGSWLTKPQSGQWQASQLEGLAVYNNNNERIGEINEMLVDNSGKIQAVVIGVGGFLGIGERDVAVPFEQVKFVNEPRANTTASNTNATGNNAAGTMGSPATTGSVGGTAGTAGGAGTAGTAGGAGTAGTSGGAGTAGTAGTTASTDRANASAERMGPDHAMLTVNMSKDELKSAPEFKYTR
jgi:sporulation protein YlmC with PRC-barrel domain